jgi:PKD repeat protein
MYRSPLIPARLSYKWFLEWWFIHAGKSNAHLHILWFVPVTLVTTNAAGCTDTIRKNDFVRIQRPQVSIVQVPQEGCVPYAYQPTIQINSPDSIISYLWNFGDNNTSTEANPLNTYTVAGIYTVTLIYTTAGGCTDSVKAIDAIRVGEKPIINFTATPRFACVSIDPV